MLSVLLLTFLFCFTKYSNMFVGQFQAHFVFLAPDGLASTLECKREHLNVKKAINRSNTDKIKLKINAKQYIFSKLKSLLMSCRSLHFWLVPFFSLIYFSDKL